VGLRETNQIKLVVYVVIFFPLVGAIAGGILGNGWFGGFIGFAAAAGLAIWLETTGTSNKLLARLFSSAAGDQNAQAGGPVGSIFESEAPKGPETTIKCSGCGSQVTLYGGHGKCEACDRAY
jgi:hypothetical protein